MTKYYKKQDISIGAQIIDKQSCLWPKLFTMVVCFEKRDALLLVSTKWLWSLICYTFSSIIELHLNTICHGVAIYAEIP